MAATGDGAASATSAACAIVAAPAPGEAESGSGGRVELRLLGGEAIWVALQPGAQVADVRAEVAAMRPLLPGTTLLLLNGCRILNDAEDAAPLAGAMLTALVSHVPLGEEAKLLLQHCLNTRTQPERYSLELLEVHMEVDTKQVPPLAELLVALQPRRLLVHKACAWHSLSKLITQDLRLESLAVKRSEPEDLPFLTSIIAHCTGLRRCDLSSGWPGGQSSFTAASVSSFRRETGVQVII